MDKKLLAKIKRQLLSENPRERQWTLPRWVAEELFKYIEELECKLKDQNE